VDIKKELARGEEHKALRTPTFDQYKNLYQRGFTM